MLIISLEADDLHYGMNGRHMVYGNTWLNRCVGPLDGDNIPREAGGNGCNRLRSATG